MESSSSLVITILFVELIAIAIIGVRLYSSKIRKFAYAVIIWLREFYLRIWDSVFIYEIIEKGDE